MAIEIKIPQISEGVDSAQVSEILVSEGDKIEKDQSVIAVESDKAAVEIPSSAAGTVKEIKVSEGDEVEVGQVIILLDGDEGEEDDSSEENDDDKDKKEDKKDSEDKSEKGEEGEEDSDKEKKKDSSDDEGGSEEEKEAEKEGKDEEEDENDKDDEDSSEEKDKKDSKKEGDDDSEKDDKDEESEEKSSDKKEKEDKADEDSGKKKDDDKKSDDKDKEDKSGDDEKSAPEGVAASPGVRRLARELGVDIEAVKGSGEQGRISEKDIKEFAKNGSQSNRKEPKSKALPDFSKWGETSTKPLSGIRKATGEHVSSAWREVPHVFQFGEADITDIEKYHQKHEEKAEKEGGKLTITAILLKIVADALVKFPKFNASLDVENEQMILKEYVHVGIAVDTEKGLLLPVIQDVNKKGIIELAVELSKVAEKARNGKLKAEEMEGGNFSISNLGGIGGTNFTPIIYQPQVAILGVSRAQTKPVYVEDKFEPRQILPLSLSYDHRLIDGAEGAEFMKWITEALEDPYQALLGE